MALALSLHIVNHIMDKWKINFQLEMNNTVQRITVKVVQNIIQHEQAILATGNAGPI